MENKSRKSLFDIINSPFLLLVAGFLFTTLVGSYINNSFHEKSWKSKARFEIFKERFKEDSEAQNSILSLSNKRIFLLRRIYFELTENRLQSARKIWKEYFSVVNEWNNNVKTNANLLSLLFDSQSSSDIPISDVFLDNTENRESNPKSLHHKFRMAHDAILSVMECMKSNCSQSEKDRLLKEADKRMDALGIAHDEFSVLLRKSLKAKESELLE